MAPPVNVLQPKADLNSAVALQTPEWEVCHLESPPPQPRHIGCDHLSEVSSTCHLRKESGRDQKCRVCKMRAWKSHGRDGKLPENKIYLYTHRHMNAYTQMLLYTRTDTHVHAHRPLDTQREIYIQKQMQTQHTYRYDTQIQTQIHAY